MIRTVTTITKLGQSFRDVFYFLRLRIRPLSRETSVVSELSEAPSVIIMGSFGFLPKVLKSVRQNILSLGRG